MYSGLLKAIQPSDDELAQVLGHEIAHALLSHQAEKMSRIQAQQLGINLGVLAGPLPVTTCGGCPDWPTP